MLHLSDVELNSLMVPWRTMRVANPFSWVFSYAFSSYPVGRKIASGTFTSLGMKIHSLKASWRPISECSYNISFYVATCVLMDGMQKQLWSAYPFVGRYDRELSATPETHTNMLFLGTFPICWKLSFPRGTAKTNARKRQLRTNYQVDSRIVKRLGKKHLSIGGNCPLRQVCLSTHPISPPPALC